MSELSTTTAAAGPIVCYDGDCGLCRGSVAGLAALGLVPRGRLAPFQSFDGETSQRLLDANVHNELAVLGADGGEVRSGIDGLLWALEGSWLAPLLPLARPRPVRAIMRVVYRLIAYNRRILSPVQAGIRCACDPDFHTGLRLGFAGVAWLATALVAALVLRLPLAVGAGALVMASAALARPWPARADALGHAAWVAWMATVAALPFAVAPHVGWVVLPLAVLLAAARRRHEALGLRIEVANALALASLGAALLVAWR